MAYMIQIRCVVSGMWDNTRYRAPLIVALITAAQANSVWAKFGYGSRARVVPA